MHALVEALKEKKWKLSSCESLTGGLFAAQLIDVSGASDVFLGALVTYATSMKHKLANVDEALIERYGVVSREVAEAMAINTRNIMGGDVCVSFTGNAGPLPSDGKPVGLVYSAIVLPDRCVIFEDHLTGSRATIRQEVVRLMGERLLDML